MAVFYLDSSALLKRYRTEKGSEVVSDLYAGNETLVTSHFSCLEVESAAARALKGRVLDQEAYDTLLAAFAADLDEFLVTMPVSSALVSEAIEVARRFGLRAGDSVQLASAMRAVAALPEGLKLIVVASDRELLTACEAAEISSLDPEADDAKERLQNVRG